MILIISVIDSPGLLKTIAGTNGHHSPKRVAMETRENGTAPKNPYVVFITGCPTMDSRLMIVD